MWETKEPIKNKEPKQKFTPKDIKEPVKEEIKEEIEEVPKINEKIENHRVIFSGPFKQEMRILKAGNYRLDNVLYNLIPGNSIEGALLDPKKRDILINTKFIENV